MQRKILTRSPLAGHQRLNALIALLLSVSFFIPFTPAAFGASRTPAASPNTPQAANAGLSLNPALPQITATKRDSFPDPDMDGKALPGDAVTYTIEIHNNGSGDASGVTFSDMLDPNTSLVPGSLTTTPIAVNDSYTSIGNVGIAVPSAAGLLANDSDADGNTLTASAPSLSAQGGNVSVNPDGSFTYNPRAGFEGTDSFNYSITDGSSPADTATATITVGGMIWFVNSAAATSGDGRLSSPFKTLTGASSFETNAADEQNDNIFIYSGSYTGGLALQSGQALIGQGAGASLAAITGLTPPAYSQSLPATGGARPDISGTSGLTVATNNLVRGLNLQSTGGTGLSGMGFGILRVAEVSVSSTGEAVHLDNGQTDASFISLSSSDSPVAGVTLVNLSAGSVFSGGTTNVDNALGASIDLSSITAGANVSFGATNITNRRATGIDLNNVHGTVSFGDTAIPSQGSAGGYGVRVRTSDAAVSFSRADISNANQTVAQTDADNDSLPENDGDGDAIFLQNNNGSFTLSGGTLSNCGNDCVDARNSSNLTLSGVTIESPGQDVTSATAAGAGGHGIQAINLTGVNSISGSTIKKFNVSNRDGVRFINDVATPASLNITGSTFSEATGANGILVSGRDAAVMSLNVGGATSDAATNCLFDGLRGAAITHAAGVNTNSTASVNLTVQHSTFRNAPVNGLNTASARTLEGGKANVVFKGNTFDTVAQTVSANTGVITVNGDATLPSNLLSITIQNNTLRNIGSAANTCGSGTAACAGYRGIQVFIDDHTKVGGNIVVDSNTLTNTRRDGIFLDFGNSATGSDVNARVTGNTVGTDAARVGRAGQSGIRIFRRCSPSGSTCGRAANVLVENNSIRNGSGVAANATNGAGLFARAEDNASLNLIVLGNNIETNSTGPAEENSTTSFPVGTGSVMCLDMSGNTLASGTGVIGLNEGSGTALNVKQASALALATANGIPAGNVTVTGSPQYNSTCAAPPVALFRTTAEQYPASVEFARQSLPNNSLLSGEKAQTASAKSSSFGRNWLAAMLGQQDAQTNWLSAVRQNIGFRFTANNAALDVRGARPAHAANAHALSTVAASGDTVALNIGTLPAGKHITITFKATISNTISVPQVSNQGTVSGANFASVVTDDPDTAAAGDPTVTPVGAPPAIACPADINVGNDPGQASAVVPFNVTATGSPNPTVTCKVGAQVITSPHAFPLGETTVSCTASNGIGADASCSFKVTVNDTQAPTIACPSNVTVNAAPGSCTANVNPGTPNFTDNDPNASVSGTRSDGQLMNAPYQKGTTTITWTASDTAGNTASCQQTVTVVDNEAPTLSVSNVVVVAPANSCSAVATFAPQGSDNCPGVNVTTDIPSGSSFNVGVTTVTATATDASGNKTTNTFTVTVKDTTAPVISCPSNIVVPLSPNSNGMPVSFNVTANDSCSTASVTTSHASGSVFPVGTTTVTATATDAAGNQSQCTFTVSVIYNFGGFFAPVANLPTFNAAKAGQSVPVKFSLQGNRGLNVFATGYPASGQIPCGSTGEPNVIQETYTAGSNTLSYDPSNDQYTYIWKTNQAWKDTCRQFVIQLNDGTFHRADFQFK